MSSRSQGSFIDSSRLYVLQGGLAQQEWRDGPLLNRLLSFLHQYLNHPYQVDQTTPNYAYLSLFLSKPHNHVYNSRSVSVCADTIEIGIACYDPIIMMLLESKLRPLGLVPT